MATYKSLVIVAGVTKQIPDADTLNTGSGITSAAAATNLTITAATGVVAVASAATFSSTATVTGQTNTDGGIGRSTSGTLNIGNEANTVAVNFATGVNTTAVTVSRVGQLTTIAGDLQVNGTQTVVGAAVFDTTVVIGDGIGGPDTLAFNATTGRFGSSALPDVKWLKEVNHQFYVDDITTAATAGGNLSIAAGLGTAAGGNLVLNAGSGTTDGTISIGATDASAIGIGQSGTTTTVTGGLTQLTGAFSLTGNGASQASTTAGALTLSGFTVLNLQSNGTTAMQVASGTSVVVQAGAVLSTTGTGNINLPNNASARFQIETVAVSANVTSANLGTLTAGPTSDASALHTHTGFSASTISIPANANQLVESATVTLGQAISAFNGTGSQVWVLGDATSSTSTACNFVGVAVTSQVVGDQLAIYVTGQAVIPNAFWDVLPTNADRGARVYLSTTPGNFTLTAPSASGQWAQRVGTVTRGTSGSVSINIDPGEGTAL